MDCETIFEEVLFDFKCLDCCSEDIDLVPTEKVYKPRFLENDDLIAGIDSIKNTNPGTYRRLISHRNYLNSLPDKSKAILNCEHQELLVYCEKCKNHNRVFAKVMPSDLKKWVKKKYGEVMIL